MRLAHVLAIILFSLVYYGSKDPVMASETAAYWAWWAALVVGCVAIPFMLLITVLTGGLGAFVGSKFGRIGSMVTSMGFTGVFLFTTVLLLVVVLLSLFGYSSLQSAAEQGFQDQSLNMQACIYLSISFILSLLHKEGGVSTNKSTQQTQTTRTTNKNLRSRTVA